MTQWQYSTTVDNLQGPPSSEPDKTFRCDEQGHCALHDSMANGGIERMEKVFEQKGKEGWELVQFEYHKNELLCVWKRPKEKAKAPRRKK